MSLAVQHSFVSIEAERNLGCRFSTLGKYMSGAEVKKGVPEGAEHPEGGHPPVREAQSFGEVSVVVGGIPSRGSFSIVRGNKGANPVQLSNLQ